MIQCFVSVAMDEQIYYPVHSVGVAFRKSSEAVVGYRVLEEVLVYLPDL